MVGLPDRRGRERILQIHTKGLKLTSDVNLDTLARTTTGFSGADLANLCNERARASLYRLVKGLLQEEIIQQDDLESILGPRPIPLVGS